MCWHGRMSRKYWMKKQVSEVCRKPPLEEKCGNRTAMPLRAPFEGTYCIAPWQPPLPHLWIHCTFTPKPTVPPGCSHQISNQVFSTRHGAPLIDNIWSKPPHPWLELSQSRTVAGSSSFPIFLLPYPLSQGSDLQWVWRCSLPIPAPFSLYPSQCFPKRSPAHLFLPCCLLLEGSKLAPKDTQLQRVINLELVWGKGSE